MKQKNSENKKKTSARSLALDSLIRIEECGKYSNLEIDTILNKNELNSADRGLYTRLVYGVTERRLTLDYIISCFSKTSLADLDPDVKNALRLGIYQLLYMDRIPDHSAVDESVSLVARSKSGFVNAILRSFIRADKKFTFPEDEFEALEVKYSVPRALIEIFFRACPGELEELLCAMNREPRIGLRINRLLLPTDGDLPEIIKARAEKSSIAPDIFLVDSLDDEIRQGIEDGLWFVQDEASRITSAALGARNGELVVDTCACPGGKSFSIAVDMHNEGKLYSFDLHKNKLSLLEKGAGRLGIKIIESEARDARNPREELVGRADRVLCDAPCSGLGVIAKKPEIRYKELGDIDKLPEIQLGVLDGASAYVKDGGVLVYSTCTVNPDENEGVIKKFLEGHSEFELKENGLLGGQMKTFLPHRDGCDGFFAAYMVKKIL